jgi:hypothetical protein
MDSCLGFRNERDGIHGNTKHAATQQHGILSSYMVTFCSPCEDVQESPFPTLLFLLPLLWLSTLSHMFLVEKEKREIALMQHASQANNEWEYFFFFYIFYRKQKGRVFFLLENDERTGSDVFLFFLFFLS